MDRTLYTIKLIVVGNSGTLALTIFRCRENVAR